MILKSQELVVEKVYVDGEKRFAGCQDAVIIATGEHVNIAEGYKSHK